MRKPLGRPREPTFVAEGLLVRDKAGKVYFFPQAIVKQYQVTNISSADVRAYFDQLREESRTIDAAFLKTMHILEGGGG
jgi:hypothetical protein